MLILRNLLLGPRRYSDLLEELPGITTNLLAKRLKDLETEGLIQKVMLSRTTAYALSEAGAALEPALMELAKWGGRYLERPHPDDRFDIGWALLSMKRRYRGGKELRVALHVGERVFDIQVQPSYVGVQEREPQSADVVLRGSLDAVLHLLFSHQDPDELLESGAIRLEGSRRTFKTFLAVFPPSASPATVESHSNVR